MRIKYSPNISILSALAPALAAVLALAGCTATHVGEDWQCPPAQGAHCASVAAADPMVRPLAPVAAGERLGDQRAEAPPSSSATARRAHGTSTTGFQDNAVRGCPALCRPFRWLGRLLNGESDGDPEELLAGERVAAGRTGEKERPIKDAARNAARAEVLPNAGLRRPEIIGRVWIAPYVDADGVYREASWVRIVIAPAAWRAP